MEKDIKQLFAILAVFFIISCVDKGKAGAEPLSSLTFPEFTTDFSNSTVPLKEIFSGGPSKDGIPADF